MRQIKFRQYMGNKRFHYFELKDGLCQGVASASLSNNPITQFTGLYDRNGKEIYEGDVVQWGDTDGEIRQDVVTYGKAKFYLCNDYFSVSDYVCVVIGNIFENPESMEVMDELP